MLAVLLALGSSLAYGVANYAGPALVRRHGFGAVLLVPIVFRGESAGLLELYRRAPRPFVHTEIQQARMLAHHLGAVLAGPELSSAV